LESAARWAHGASCRQLGAPLRGGRGGGVCRDLAAMSYQPGTQVEYFSTSMGQWIPAKVVRNGQAPGTFDLDCKDAVDTSRIRLAGGASAPSKGSGRGTLNGPLMMREGDSCFYKSSTHGWITAQVVKFRPEDGSYDLDVKQQVPQQSIFAISPGQGVEYHSASSNSWIPASVVRKGAAADTFDLDCKDGVPIARIRPPKDYVPSRGGGGSDMTCLGMGRRSGGYGGGGLSAISEQGGYHSSESQRLAKLDQLNQAMQAENPEELRKRLESTSALGLVGEEALDMAGHKLWQMQARPEAQADLRKATAGGSRAALEIALEAAAAAGVPDGELEAARQALKRLSISPLWRYDPGDGHHIDVRQGPKFDGARVKKRLEAGDVFCVSEERQGTDAILYLQLADGRGWLFEKKPGVGAMCQRYAYNETDSPGSYVIIHDDTAVTPTEAVGPSEQILTKLPARTAVRITQVSKNMSAQRIRGKLENPVGWISLLDTDSGIRWAIKHTPTGARMM